MTPNFTRILEQANDAYWSFPEDSLSSPKRMAAALQVVLETGLCHSFYLRPNLNRILMPDIAMCSGDECPIKENCYRYLANPSHFQSFFAPPPYTEEGCDYFWDVNEK